MKKEQIIKIMEHLGYKHYVEGNDSYFLPVQIKINKYKKIKYGQIESIFNNNEHAPTVAKKSKSKKNE